MYSYERVLQKPTMESECRVYYVCAREKRHQKFIQFIKRSFNTDSQAAASFLCSSCVFAERAKAAQKVENAELAVGVMMSAL